MSRITLTNVKSYANSKNAIKAVEKLIGTDSNLRYFIHFTEEGRCFPVFIGEAALQQGIHFHFNVIG